MKTYLVAYKVKGNKDQRFTIETRYNKMSDIRQDYTRNERMITTIISEKQIRELLTIGWSEFLGTKKVQRNIIEIYMDITDAFEIKDNGMIDWK